MTASFTRFTDYHSTRTVHIRPDSVTAVEHQPGAGRSDITRIYTAGGHLFEVIEPVDIVLADLAHASI